MKTTRLIPLLSAMAMIVMACNKSEKDKPEPDKPDPSKPETGYVREIEATPAGYYDLTTATSFREPSGAEEAYTPSSLKRKYRPITIQYYGGSAPAGTPAGGWNPSWTNGKARVLRYMSDYEPAFKTFEKYAQWVNKYGSTKTMSKGTATGRFHTEQIDGRWWIIDPMGYRHYERSVTSLRRGSSSRNATAFNAKYGGSNPAWIADVRATLFMHGFHGTGAFCTDTYDDIITHDTSNPNAPLTLAPSFGFLSQFRKAKNVSSTYPDQPLFSIIAVDGWEEWCKQYMAGTAFDMYRNNPNVLGFFSDNEINFSTNAAAGRLLKVALAIGDKNDPVRKFADNFMAEKNATAYSDALNDEFSGILAQKYYKGVKEARDAADPGLMYLGTRLHGYPKYMEYVVRACGAYCDIVSINYYGRWAPELEDYVIKWNTWARKPFLVTEFYVKGIYDSDLNNQSGAGWAVPRQEDRAYWYQHFTLGLLEARNCVGWHWFKYQDDDGTDNSSQPANKGMFDNNYEIYPDLGKLASQINFNVYDLIDYFDGRLK